MQNKEIVRATFIHVKLIYVRPPVFTTTDPEFANCNLRIDETFQILENNNHKIISLKQIQVNCQDGLHFTPETSDKLQIKSSMNLFTFK
jgi:hypothetical protein